MIDERVKRLQNTLGACEAALITNDANRRYFTGFASSAGAVLVTAGAAYFLIDFRYFERAKRQLDFLNVILCTDLNAQVYGLLSENRTETLLLEGDSVSVTEYEKYKKAFDAVSVTADGRLDREIKKLRSIKSAEELSLIKDAQKLTDDTLQYILPRIAAGRTEREIMLDMEFFMRRAGSEGVSFDFIVISGKNTSLPHGVPTDKRVEKGDFVTMDFGAVVRGYRSDMTRTVAVGSVSDDMRTVYETVLRAQKKALGFIKSGVSCRDTDSAARDIINAAGYNGCFGHALGHSVGIEIHESPACGPKSTGTLETGMIMTVEPGIYLEGRFGVRIEDMVSVTDSGCENLTNSPKELIIL